MQIEKISIVVPCYNVEGVLDRCLQSIVDQSIGLESLEIILVNDASTDHTYDKLCEWEQRYPDHIMVINCTENGRQGTARNIGMSYATGSYIGFVDSDDWIDEKMYEVLYEAITHYDCEVSAILFQRELEDGSVVRSTKKFQSNQRHEIRTMDERKRFLTQGGLPGGVYTKLYRRDFIEANQLYFPEKLFYEDNFWGALMGYSLSSYVVIDKILYHYMINDNSTTTGSGARHLDRLKVDVMTVEELKNRGFWQEYHDEIERSFLKSYWCMMLRRMILQFPVFPYDILDIMRKTVKILFPDYKNNSYLTSFSLEDRVFLELIELKLSREEMDRAVQKYRKTFTEEAYEKYQ